MERRVGGKEMDKQRWGNGKKGRWKDGEMKSTSRKEVEVIVRLSDEMGI